MSPVGAPIATEIKLRTKSRLLEVTFEDGSRFELPFEYLRVHSPSAEVKGHGPGQEVLVLGKENVGIRSVEPVGQYAVKLAFDDGHDTGLYSWKYLYELGRDREKNWARYLERRNRVIVADWKPGESSQPTAHSLQPGKERKP
ncbi:MAG: gamma-butyrobetaine hydroxylase-like domain-containing protein [Gammaproteobacteria bacterium]